MIGLMKTPATLKGMKTLTREGYSNKQKKELIARIWLKWIPKKVSAMIWLTIARDLLIGNGE